LTLPVVRLAERRLSADLKDFVTIGRHGRADSPSTRRSFYFPQKLIFVL
jgi:hypothetical protein